MPARYASDEHAPLNVPGEIVRLDTAGSVDLDALTERLRALL